MAPSGCFECRTATPPSGVAATSTQPPLLLAPAALRHIVLNLLDNAVKYGPTGQTVRVRVHSIAGEVQIEVADQGPGVPSGDRQTVWQAYHRGSTAGHNAGSGLGLSIVHDVVALHGGRAWISDPPEGSGAVFVVALPAAPSAARAASTASRGTTHIDAAALS